MADSSELLKKLRSELTCPLCLDIFKKPKKLPCDHVYCRECLHGLTLRSNHGIISCPACRNNVPVPRNGVDEFPIPHQVIRLVEIYQESLVPTSTQVAAAPEPTTCEVHTSQPLALYCETCERLVCKDCSCVKENHKHGPIDSTARRIRSELNKELEPIKQFHQEMLNSLGMISAAKRELLSEKKAKLQQIEEHFDMLAKLLESEKYEFTKCFRISFQEQYDLYSAKEKELSGVLPKLELAIQSVNSSDSDLSFISTSVDKKKNLELIKTRTSEISLQLSRLPELGAVLCSSDEFRNFICSRSYVFCKSDPLQCHFDRSGEQEDIVCGNESDITMLVDPHSIEMGDFKLTAALQCCSDKTLSEVNIEEVSDEKYSLSFVPLKKGKHKMNVKFDDKLICQLPVYVQLDELPADLVYEFAEGVSTMKFYGDKLYANQHNEVLLVINPSDLSILKTIDVPGICDFLLEGNCIYATYATESRLKKMYLNGTIIATTGTYGNAPGQFNHPSGIRLSKNSEIYVCDSKNHRIQVFDKDLKLIRILGCKGSDVCCFDWPVSLDFDDDGNVYVAENSNSRVQVLTPHGQHVRIIGRTASSVDKLLLSPISLAIYKDLVHVTDPSHHCVSVYKKTGEFVRQLGCNILSRPECLTIDDKGHVYVSESRYLLLKF